MQAAEWNFRRFETRVSKSNNLEQSECDPNAGPVHLIEVARNTQKRVHRVRERESTKKFMVNTKTDSK